MNNDVLMDRIIDFSAGAAKISKIIRQRYGETFVADSLERAAAAIGVNYSDAVFPLNKTDFILKLQLALKKITETEYWLKYVSRLFDVADEAAPLLKECAEIKKIFAASAANAKKERPQAVVKTEKKESGKLS
jgi:four helix bundle protein